MTVHVLPKVPGKNETRRYVEVVSVEVISKAGISHWETKTETEGKPIMCALMRSFLMGQRGFNSARNI